MTNDERFIQNISELSSSISAAIADIVAQSLYSGDDLEAELVKRGLQMKDILRLCIDDTVSLYCKAIDIVEKC